MREHLEGLIIYNPTCIQIMDSKNHSIAPIVSDVVSDVTIWKTTREHMKE